MISARLWLLGCGLALQSWALTNVFYTPGGDLSRHVALTLAAWAVWVGAIWLALGLPASHQRRDLVLILGLGAVMRLTLLASTPSLSDDVYRAVWDARLVHAGVNPYAYPPAAPELAIYRDSTIWPRVNHPEQRTPYPPLAELLGAAAYALAPERLSAMQALYGMLDLFTAGLLAWLLVRLGMDARRCIVVAWSPIGALHFAHSAHNDSAMIAAMVSAALLLTYGRSWLAAVAHGLATMVKWVPAVTLPAFGHVTGVPALGPWALTCAGLSLALLGAGTGLLGGVLDEAGGQRFNDSAYFIVERVATRVAPSLAGIVPTLFVLVSVGIAAVLSWVWGDPTPGGALVGGARVLGVYLLVAPVVEPWYLTWLAPLVAVTIQRGERGPFALSDAPAWIWLSGMATLTDLTYPAGGAALWPAIRAVEYLPTYGLLALASIQWIMPGAERKRDD